MAKSPTTLSYRALWQALNILKTSTTWEKHSKELNILFSNLIYESERDFLTFSIKNHLKKKNPETALTCTKFPESGIFRKFLIPRECFFFYFSFPEDA